MTARAILGTISRLKRASSFRAPSFGGGEEGSTTKRHVTGSPSWARSLPAVQFISMTASGTTVFRQIWITVLLQVPTHRSASTAWMITGGLAKTSRNVHEDPFGGKRN